MYKLVNDGRYSGEQIDPPEYAPTAPVYCHTCRAEYDEDDIGDMIYRGPDDEYYCHNCQVWCEWCGDVCLTRKDSPDYHAFGDHYFCPHCFADLLCGCPEE